MKITLVLISTLGLFACATTPKQERTPSNEPTVDGKLVELMCKENFGTKRTHIAFREESTPEGRGVVGHEIAIDGEIVKIHLVNTRRGFRSIQSKVGAKQFLLEEMSDGPDWSYHAVDTEASTCLPK